VTSMSFDRKHLADSWPMLKKVNAALL